MKALVRDDRDIDLWLVEYANTSRLFQYFQSYHQDASNGLSS